MKRKIKNKILLWFRIGAVPAMIFSALNAIGITTLAAPKKAVAADEVVNSSISGSPAADVIKPAPISEAVIEPVPQQKIDISYLTTGTTAAVYMRTDQPITIILPDGTMRELPIKLLE